MQNRPDKVALLDAVFRFLVSDLQPTVQDKALAFRVLIAANLVQIVTSELRGEESRLREEYERLRPLVPNTPPASEALAGDALQNAVKQLVQSLSQQLQTGAIPSSALPEVRQALLASLRSSLAVSNPRFDLDPELE